MAIQVINDPSWGSQVGVNLGQQLSKSLNDLAERKALQLSTRHGLKAFNIAPEKAEQISYLPPALQQQFVKSHLEQPQNAAFGAALGEALGGQPQQMQPQPAQDLQGLLNNPNLKPQQRAQIQQMIQQRAQQAPVQQVPGSSEIGLANILAKYPNLRPEQQLKLAELHNKNKKLTAEERREQHAIEKEERPFYERTMEEYGDVRNSLNNVNRAINLIQSGKTSNPTEDSFKRWMGSILKVNLSDFVGADTEQYNKIVKSFISNAKTWFPGGRVTNLDLQNFIETLPTLSMTNEGKLRVLTQMKAVADAKKMKHDAMREVMRLNGGHLPQYAEDKVNKMIEPEMDKLSEAFINGTLTPKLTPEAEAANKRNWGLRWLQLTANAAGTIAKMFGGLLQGGVDVAGDIAGLSHAISPLMSSQHMPVSIPRLPPPIP